MPPRRQQPDAPPMRLINRRAKLETSFFDCLELNKERYAALDEIEQDDDISEKTREKRLAAINRKIDVTEDKMSAYRDKIEEIDAALAARGHSVEPFESVIDSMG